MMDSLEAARRIEDHLRAHHMKEQPRCEKITEALTLAVKVLTQHSNEGGVVARFMGFPIECHHVSPDETIVLRFNMMEHDIDTVRRTHNIVKEEFPNNTVITIPQNLSFEYLTRANLAELKAQIESIMEGVRF